MVIVIDITQCVKGDRIMENVKNVLVGMGVLGVLGGSIYGVSYVSGLGIGQVIAGVSFVVIWLVLCLIIGAVIRGI